MKSQRRFGRTSCANNSCNNIARHRRSSFRSISMDLRGSLSFHLWNFAAQHGGFWIESNFARRFILMNNSFPSRMRIRGSRDSILSRRGKSQPFILPLRRPSESDERSISDVRYPQCLREYPLEFQCHLFPGSSTSLFRDDLAIPMHGDPFLQQRASSSSPIPGKRFQELARR